MLFTLSTPKINQRVIRSDKPIISVYPVKSHICDFGAELRSRIIATSAVKGLIQRKGNFAFFLHKKKTWFK
jgi:hypothetical protein